YYLQVLTFWLAIGGMLYRRKTNMLPFSVEECTHLNYSSVNNSGIQGIVNSTYSSLFEDTNVDTSFINSFYQISYTLYGSIGPVLCILLAVVVSLITDIRPPKHIEKQDQESIMRALGEWMYLP
ncbi:hypothetical protein Anas_01809, partial [Armadillidium nasatum]